MSDSMVNKVISCFLYQVLDAPELQDDFYLNLVDWSSQNMLSVGLGTCVYLWSAHTSQVTRLCDLSTDSDSVTSVAWSDRVRLVCYFFYVVFFQSNNNFKKFHQRRVTGSYSFTIVFMFFFSVEY